MNCRSTRFILFVCIAIGFSLRCFVFADDLVLPPKPDEPPTITYWYGDDQRFGELGDSQPLINILGSVQPASHAANLWYQLNNGPPQQLILGMDLHRLARPGDFNVEIERAKLKPGENTFRITLHDLWGRKQVRELTIHSTQGRAWPLPYEVDFSEIENLQSVVDVIDGKWVRTDEGVRTAEPYYDRVLAFGDAGWKDMELYAELIFHRLFVNFENRVLNGPPYLSHSHASFNMRWAGFPDDGKVPRRDWRGLGCLVALRCDLSQNEKGSYWWMHYGHARKNVEAKRSEMQPENRFQIQPGQRYRYRMRVETIEDGNARYSTKLWNSQEPEPQQWQMIGKDLAETVHSGSIAFVVHHSDVTLCKVKVTSLMKE